MVIEFNLIGPALIEFDIVDEVINFALDLPQVIEFELSPGGLTAGGYVSPNPIAVVDGTTFNIPAGKKLDSFSIIPETGDRILSIGYSAGTGELVDEETIYSDDGASFHQGRYFHNGQTIHFSDFIGSVLIYLL